MQNSHDIWFRLPPGYLDLDLDGLGPLREAMLDELALLHSDSGQADRRRHECRSLFGLLDGLLGQGLVHAAFGVHSGEESGLLVSLFSLSEIDTGAPGPTSAAARCALDLAVAGLGDVRERGIVRLPCGTPAALVTSLLPEPPPSVLGPTASGLPAFQARLAIARPSGARVVVADLTTSAAAHADAYTDILLAIGQTVSFTDPDQPTEAETPLRPSRLLEVLL